MPPLLTQFKGGCMALSNIFNEPRREITESVIGIAVLALVIYGDHIFAMHMVRGSNDIGDAYMTDVVGAHIATLFIFAVVWFVGFIFSHYIGEKICDFMRKQGWDPRPSRRV